MLSAACQICQRALLAVQVCTLPQGWYLCRLPRNFGLGEVELPGIQKRFSTRKVEAVHECQKYFAKYRVS